MNLHSRLMGLGAVLLAACGVPASRSQPDPGDGDSTAGQRSAPAAAVESVQVDVGGAAPEASVSGKVETFGVAPATMVAVRSADGQAVRVEGPLAEEIGRLVGATVTLFGTRQTAGPLNTVMVERYDILAVDGQVPYIGVVRITDGTVWLEADRRLVLRGVGSTLEGLAGAKIYVLGTRTADTIAVASVGVIRPAR